MLAVSLLLELQTLTYTSVREHITLAVIKIVLQYIDYITSTRMRKIAKESCFYTIIDSLEKFLSASQLVIGSVAYIYRIVLKSGQTSCKFLSYMS